MDKLSFVDSGMGDSSYYVIVEGTQQPFLGYGGVRSFRAGRESHMICMVKRKVDDQWFYSVSIDGREPPPDDWFSKPVSIVRLMNDGARCRVSNKGRFKFSWPAKTYEE